MGLQCGTINSCPFCHKYGRQFLPLPDQLNIFSCLFNYLLKLWKLDLLLGLYELLFIIYKSEYNVLNKQQCSFLEWIKKQVKIRG